MKQIPLVLEECLPCTCGCILLCIEEYMQVDAFWLLSSNRFGVQLLLPLLIQNENVNF